VNPLQNISIVAQKEIRDNLRDHRSIASSLSSTLIGPIILLVLIVIIGRTLFQDPLENPLSLPVAGVQNAPMLVQFLEQNGVEIQPAPSDPENQVRNGDLDVVLVIPEGFREDFSAGQPATVQMIADTSRQSAVANIERTRSLLRGYDQMIGAMRLQARGINPVVVQPLAIETVDVATPQSQAVMFLNMMPYFIVLVVFVGGMYVIIDATAGERERGSLEPLLINPIPRRDFVLGKLIASWPFAIFSVFLTLLAFAIAFNVFPVEDFLGIQLTLNLAALAAIFVIALPMVVLASALQMIVAAFSRSFKEAQTYVSFLSLVPSMPGIGLAFLPVKPSLLTMAIPTFGQQILINQLMRGEPVNLNFALFSAAITLLTAVVLIFFAVRLYSRERVIFGAR